MNHDEYSYNYYYPHNSQSSSNSWPREWEYQQYPPSPYMQNFNRSSYSHPTSHARFQSYLEPPPTVNGNRSYFPSSRASSRYPKVVNPYNGVATQSRPPIPNSYKRNRSDSTSEAQVKPSKKKKKPLSQNVPKNNWTIAEAEWALATEKELNKKTKNSLIIKFPDQELNKDIVTQLHVAIDSVHFKQPCTPRFCYVTLQDSAKPEDVISEINQKKFGNGNLVAEYKRDREEDMVINAEDIDPLTLYVGNLDQEVTKEAIQNMFPNCKRMDIGFAKKMKFTRYAFIGFRTVADAVEAFKNTHNNELYNKSIIVRFRRLHGTVGLPGESKLQNPPKPKDETLDTLKSLNSTLNDTNELTNQSINRAESDSLVDILDMALPSSSKEKSPEVSIVYDNLPEKVALKEIIKREVDSPIEDEDDEDETPYDDPFSIHQLEDIIDTHRPIKIENIKEEKKSGFDATNKVKIKSEIPETDLVTGFQVKPEPDDGSDDGSIFGMDYDDDDDDDEDYVEEDLHDAYENMVSGGQKQRSLDKGK